MLFFWLVSLGNYSTLLFNCAISVWFCDGFDLLCLTFILLCTYRRTSSPLLGYHLLKIAYWVSTAPYLPMDR